MKYVFTLIVLAIFFCGCNDNNDQNTLLSTPGDLKSVTYVVDLNRDTTLRTEHGAILKIPCGTLSVSNGNKVALEIKEAYSLSQIIKAGLTTGSNGSPLSSGGMIYINPKDGQDVRINKPIEVSIPAKFLQKDMKTYKGEENEDGTINWVNPETLSENTQLTAITKGQ